VALELLRHAHFAVALAENGSVALEKLQAFEYDLVLMDMQMPVMDGITATRKLRRLPNCARVPVVAMTANVMSADRQRCVDAGMNDFLAKPIEPDLLWQALLKWIPARHEAVSVPVAATVVGQLPPAEVLDLGIAALNPGPALRRMLGKTELYFATLRKFCTVHENMPELTRAAMAAEDWEAAVRQAHTLKGVAASIGANALSQAAAALEGFFAARLPRADLLMHLDALADKLRNLIGELREKLPAPASASLPDAADGAAAAAELEQLLAENNPEAMAALERNAGALRAILPTARFTEIEAAVRNCDLDDALRLLRQFLGAGEST
jgi:two-component system sensor histidine kinase/response regulator